LRTRPLPLWNDGHTTSTIVEFVESVTTPGSPDFVPVADRIAVFDNDGTLWCEKPMPIELGFIRERLAAVAAGDAALREREPWQAAFEKDYRWLGGAVTKHYHGDDSDLKLLVVAALEAFDGLSVEAYEAAANAFLRKGQHPTLGRPLSECAYEPMIELLRYLEAHAFTNYIVSGGDRDFMRCIAREMYDIPPERVIGSSTALRYQDGDGGGRVAYRARPDLFDDGPAKPVRIWSRIGQRPLITVGNSNGDIEMLRFAGGARPALRLIVLHDDKAREFDYAAGAERALELAKSLRWTVISMWHDWSTVFAPAEVPAVVSRPTLVRSTSIRG
jgi:phosphoserine phosphatase